MAKKKKYPSPTIDPKTVVFPNGDKIRRSFNQYRGGFLNDKWIAYRAFRSNSMDEMRHYAIVDEAGEILYHENQEEAIDSLDDPRKQSVRQRLYGG